MKSIVCVALVLVLAGCASPSLPIDYAAGARFALVNYLIARELANDAARPQWNTGDFFGGLFAAKP